MIMNGIENTKHDRANFIKDVEYVKEMAMDDMIDERLEMIERAEDIDTEEDLMEAAEYVDRLGSDEDLAEEDAEISANEVDRILNSDDQSISFMEMLGFEEVEEYPDIDEEVEEDAIDISDDV